MTATAEKQASPYDLLAALPDDELTDLLESQRTRRASLGEKIILDHLRAGDFPGPRTIDQHVRHPFPAEELAVLDSLGFTNDADGRHKLVREIGRLKGVLELQAIAGTSEERTALRERRSAAHDALERRAPQIEQQLLALEQELAGLKRAAAELDRDIDQREEAVARLLDKAPAWRQELFRKG
jgi:hypothetical protein